ncbi:MAG: beta-lactamase family protein [Bacteroidales bacterium]|nr:beta-lactamase family protein [Bacteroidales bacterium]
MKRLFLFLALTVCITATAGPGVKDSKTNYAREALKPYVDSGVLPGAISILYNDGVQETCCIGYSDVARKRPIRLDDVFMQCSQTKGFCGVTIAKLVEDGKISLDDPVSKYLPEFSELWVLDEDKDGVRTLHKAKNVLTIRMVLNHTGGFAFESVAKRDNIPGGGWNRGVRLRQAAIMAANTPLMFEPGTKASYSNLGIDIGAAVVEVVTGMKWEDYLKTAILDPLGMKNTGIRPTKKQLKHLVEMYDVSKDKPAVYRLENGWSQRPYDDPEMVASAGAGIWTTAADQLKFYKMLMNLGMGDNGVRVLKEETVKSILALSTRPEGMGGYSLGLNAPEHDGEDEWFGHGGAWGTNCNVNWHKKQLRLWVVQVLGDQTWNDDMNKAADKFFSQTLDNKKLNEYTGRMK